MKKILIVFLTLFIPYLSSEIPENDESDQQHESTLTYLDDEGSWPLFFSQTKENQILIRFPVFPLIEETEKMISYTAVDRGVFPIAIYGLSFYKNLPDPEDPISLFDQVLESRSNNQSMLLWKNVTIEDDRYVLDVMSKTENLKVFRKDRVIVTGRNVYYLFTIFFPNTPENHEYFTNSFEILK